MAVLSTALPMTALLSIDRHEFESNSGHVHLLPFFAQMPWNPFLSLGYSQ